MYAQRGTDDDFFAEYPATPEEALAPESLDRRIPYAWIEPVFRVVSANAQAAHGAAWPYLPGVPGLSVYGMPQRGRSYVIGADPAEGNPNSDDSAATVLDVVSGEEVASLRGKIEPTVFAEYLDALADFYTRIPLWADEDERCSPVLGLGPNGVWGPGAAWAPTTKSEQGSSVGARPTVGIMVERNNHGYTVIAALQRSGKHRVLDGHDDRQRWLSNLKGKVILYTQTADAIRDRYCTIHTPETAAQLASIEASTLRAPSALHDDLADSFALAVAGTLDPRLHAVPSVAAAPVDALEGVDKDRW